MKVWILSFFIIFALVEFCQWIKEFSLPAPIFVLAGAFLAIASNYEKGIGSWFSKKTPLDSVLQQSATLVDSTPILQPQEPQIQNKEQETLNRE